MIKDEKVDLIFILKLGVMFMVIIVIFVGIKQYEKIFFYYNYIGNDVFVIFGM